ncbi:hypothetical protein ABIA30_003126 [Mycobacterium sp. MAA66]|uniref:hypothetical protein n=1 Tax=Mycobacterium sp. MAA66 TaxID=3156297 RepID=UPI003511DE1B
MSAQSCSAGYDWCHGGSPDCSDDHYSAIYQRATLGNGAHYALGPDSNPLSIGTGVRFNAADGEAAPSITVHIEGGSKNRDAQVDLRINEAYEFSRLLDKAIMDATKATLDLLPPQLAADLLEAS